jgi:hypothetical protein
MLQLTGKLNNKKMSEILTNQQQEFRVGHEAVRSELVFPSEEQLLELSMHAMARGDIQTELFDRAALGQYPDVVPRVKLHKEDLVEGSLDEDAKKYGFYGANFDDLKLCDPDSVVDKVSKETDESVAVAAASENTWYLSEPRLKEHVENGNVAQAFEITTDDGRRIPVVNFSETELSQEQIEEIRSVTDKVNQLSTGIVFDVSSAICILPEGSFSEGVLGLARGFSGVIALNESLINGSSESKLNEKGLKPKFNNHGLSMLEATLTHEQWHLLEIADTQINAFAKSTGWSSEERRLVDDYGNVERVTVDRLDVLPSSLHINGKNGELTEVDSFNHYGIDTLTSAKPVTDYGYTNDREDSAESFVPFTHTDRDDTKSLDMIRRNALTGILQRMGNSETNGPRLTSISEIDPRDLIKIRPKKITVGEPVFNYPIVSNSSVFKNEITDPENWYNNYNKRKIVDDYGNQMDVNTRQPTTYL